MASSSRPCAPVIGAARKGVRTAALDVHRTFTVYTTRTSPRLGPRPPSWRHYNHGAGARWSWPNQGFIIDVEPARRRTFRRGTRRSGPASTWEPSSNAPRDAAASRGLSVDYLDRGRGSHFTRAFPGRQPTDVTIVLADGTELSEHADFHRGEAESSSARGGAGKISGADRTGLGCRAGGGSLRPLARSRAARPMSQLWPGPKACSRSPYVCPFGRATRISIANSAGDVGAHIAKAAARRGVGGRILRQPTDRECAASRRGRCARTSAA